MGSPWPVPGKGTEDEIQLLPHMRGTLDSSNEWPKLIQTEPLQGMDSHIKYVVLIFLKLAVVIVQGHHKALDTSQLACCAHRRHTVSCQTRKVEGSHMV